MFCKFFDPTGSWTWFVLEGEETENDDFLFFGYVIGFEAEFGYFSLRELQGAKYTVSGLMALSIERDLVFQPCTLSEAKNSYKREHGMKA